MQNRLAFFTGNLYNYKAIDAGVAELADAPDLGSGRRLCRFKSCRPHHLYKAKKMPPPKNRATARFFGVQEAKKRPSRDDVFWEMPPRFLGSEPSHRPKPSPTETAKEKIFEKAHRKKPVGLFAFLDKFSRRYDRVPRFTNNVIDQAYENFMKQIPGFHREPDEARTIQKDMERDKKKGGRSHDLPK